MNHRLRKYLGVLRDPRLPHFLPLNFLKRFLFDLSFSPARKLSYALKSSPALWPLPALQPSKVFFSLTCDFEHDYGSMGNFSHEQVQQMRTFLLHFSDLLSSLHVRSTIFTQADLLPHVSDIFRKMADQGHEIGLHGLHHERFGEAWFLPEKTLSIEKQRDVLQESLNIFQESGLKRPISFRAPDMMLSPESYALLFDLGFHIDSSPPSYLGVPPIPYKKNNLFVLPVTADPRPSFRLLRGYIPLSDFQVFQLFLLTHMSENALREYVQRVIHFQMKKKIVPHLIFLTHPWEYRKSRRTEAAFRYCSEKNYEILSQVIRFLQREFDIEFVSLQTLSLKASKCMM